MDPNQFASRLGAGTNNSLTPSGNSLEYAAILNLIDSAEREAHRQSSLQAAARGLVARPPIGARYPAQDQLVLDAIMDARRAQQPNMQAIMELVRQQQQHNTAGSIQSRDELPPLRIPSPSDELPSVKNMQLRLIDKPHIHDVLIVKGAFVNTHVGNERFRQLIQSQKERYLQSNNREKGRISDGIVRAIRAQNPPGRFLERNQVDGKYNEIGDYKAREKAAQALRKEARDDRKSNSSPNETAATNPMMQSLPLHSQHRGQENLPAAAATPLPPPPSFSGAAFGLSGRTALPGELTRNGILPFLQQPRDVNTMEAVENAIHMRSNGLSLNNLNSNSGETGLSDTLAAEIMAAHVERQARVAQLAATTEVSTRIGTLSRGPVDSKVCGCDEIVVLLAGPSS